MKRIRCNRIEADVSWTANPLSDKFQEGLEAHRRLAVLIREFDRRGITYEQATSHMLFSLGPEFTKEVWCVLLDIAEGRKSIQEIVKALVHAAELRQSRLN